MTTFKDLSTPLKIGIIGGWVALVFYGIGFLIGFIDGLTAVI